MTGWPILCRGPPGERPPISSSSNGISTTTLEGRIMLRRAGRIVSLMALALALATVVLAPSAVAQPTASARFGEAATLVAKGAAVDVAVIYSCSPDVTFPGTNFDLTQRIDGKHLATGSGGSNDFICDGIERTTIVRVIGSGGIPFKKGDAVAQGRFNACGSFGCTFIPLSGTVRIR